MRGMGKIAEEGNRHEALVREKKEEGRGRTGGGRLEECERCEGCERWVSRWGGEKSEVRRGRSWSGRSWGRGEKRR